MSNEQWTTLKAIAPVLGVLVAVISFSVSATTSILIARYNAKKAAQLSILAELRREWLHRLRPSMSAIESLISTLEGTMKELQLTYPPDYLRREDVESDSQCLRSGELCNTRLFPVGSAQWTLVREASKLSRELIDGIREVEQSDTNETRHEALLVGMKLNKTLLDLLRSLDDLVFSDDLRS